MINNQVLDQLITLVLNIKDDHILLKKEIIAKSKGSEPLNYPEEPQPKRRGRKPKVRNLSTPEEPVEQVATAPPQPLGREATLLSEPPQMVN